MHRSCGAVAETDAYNNTHKPTLLHCIPGSLPSHVLSWPALPCTALQCPVLSCPALPCPVLSCPVLSCPVPVLPSPGLPCLALPCTVLSCPALSCPALSCPVLPCPVLSCPVLSCPVLSCPCPVLPCLVLSCPVQRKPGSWHVVHVTLTRCTAHTRECPYTPLPDQASSSNSPRDCNDCASSHSSQFTACQMLRLHTWLCAPELGEAVHA